MSYFQGQGRIFLALRNATGVLGGFEYISDTSEFMLEFNQKFDDVRENTSGQRQIAAHILTEYDAKVTLTMEEWSQANLIRALSGTSAGTEDRNCGR